MVHHGAAIVGTVWQLMHLVCLSQPYVINVSVSSKINLCALSWKLLDDDINVAGWIHQAELTQS